MIKFAGLGLFYLCFSRMDLKARAGFNVQYDVQQVLLVIGMIIVMAMCSTHWFGHLEVNQPLSKHFLLFSIGLANLNLAFKGLKLKNELPFAGGVPLTQLIRQEFSLAEAVYMAC